VSSTLLVVSRATSLAIAFSTPRSRRPLKWVLVFALLFAWASHGSAVAQIRKRTGSTLVTPGGVRQPHLIEQATREGLMLALALGGPALLATALGWLSLKATRPPKR